MSAHTVPVGYPWGAAYMSFAIGDVCTFTDPIVTTPVSRTWEWESWPSPLATAPAFVSPTAASTDVPAWVVDGTYTAKLTRVESGGATTVQRVIVGVADKVLGKVLPSGGADAAGLGPPSSLSVLFGWAGGLATIVGDTLLDAVLRGMRNLLVQAPEGSDLNLAAGAYTGTTNPRNVVVRIGDGNPAHGHQTGAFVLQGTEGIIADVHGFGVSSGDEHVNQLAVVLGGTDFGLSHDIPLVMNACGFEFDCRLSYGFQVNYTNATTFGVRFYNTQQSQYGFMVNGNGAAYRGAVDANQGGANQLATAFPGPQVPGAGQGWLWYNGTNFDGRNSAGDGLRLFRKLISGAVSTAVTHVGSGPVVTVSGTPIAFNSVKLTISTGGVRGVAAFTYQVNGGTASAPVLTAATFTVPSTGITVAMPTGTYVLGDTYAWSTVGDEIQDLGASVGGVSKKSGHWVDGVSILDIYQNAAGQTTLNAAGIFFIGATSTIVLGGANVLAQPSGYMSLTPSGDVYIRPGAGSGSGLVHIDADTTTTTPGVGGHALPATAAGWWHVVINNVDRYIPYY